MSAKINKIERYRMRIALAYLDFCQRHYRGQWVDVVLENTAPIRVDISQKSIEQIMQRFIENQLRAEFGAEAELAIKKAYDAMLGTHSGLTALGVTTLEDTMKALVADKLQNPDNFVLQVVA